MPLQGRDDDVTVEDVGIDDAVIINIEVLLNEHRSIPSKPRISEVDDRLRQVNEKDYEPKIVSIGPIHRGNYRYKIMEQHKARILLELLHQTDNLSLEKLVGEVRRMEDDARGCYSKSLNLDKDKFLETLLLDGCFIIQLIRNYYFGKSKDPIFESETLVQITHDLLLFENQLPFFVLRRLFDMTKTGSNPNNNLCHLILFLVGDMVPWLEDSKTQLQPNPDHLLGLVYRCISTKMPPKPNSNPSAKVSKSPMIHKNSASELIEFGGVELKMSKYNHLTFSGKVLHLPPLHVYGETESLLRNLMAYEQLQLKEEDPMHVTDYLFFLHSLSRSIKDVEILRRNGIITNYTGGDENILRMFDSLGTNYVRSSGHTYSDVFKSLKKRCSRPRNEWMATLHRTYFNSPWSIIKLLAAALLLLFAATEAMFAVLSFMKRRGN